MHNRVLYSDNGTFSDYTVNLNKFRTGEESFNFVAAEDYIYIGSWAPFNHLFFKMGSTVNANNVNISIEYWEGNNWESVVEIFDETNGLQQDGFITWVPNQDEKWFSEDTEDMNNSGLQTRTIYDRYWLRISFDGDLTAGTSLKWLGQKFSDDNDLADEFPQLLKTEYLTGFESGKTDWEEQHVAAAQIMIQDIKNSKQINFDGQILAKEDFKRASVQKVAELVYNTFGEDFREEKVIARTEYWERLKKVRPAIDKDKDAIVDRSEKKAVTGFMSR
jgi:hypothetical protein